MKMIVSIATYALAMSVLGGNIVANAREGWNASTPCGACHGATIQEMASKPAPKETKAEAWYIRGIQTLNGAKSETRFTQREENGNVFVALFPSKKACDEARTTHPNVAGSLAAYAAAVKARKGTSSISCQPWKAAITPDDDESHALPPGHPPIKPTIDPTKGQDI